MLIARKIAYNVAVSSVSKILSTILALISIALITRYLGASGFGNYATVLAFLSFFSALADFGLNQTTTREISRPASDESSIMGHVFPLRIAISLTILILSPIIVFFFPYPTEVKQAIVIVALSFVFSSSYQILNGVFQKNLAMDKVAISELSGKFLQLGFVYLAIKMDLGFLLIVSALLFNMILSFTLIFLWSKKYITFKIKISVSYWKNFIKESYPLGIAAFIGFVYFKLDTILLSILKTSTDVGIYNVAYKVIENITFFPSMIIGLIFPIMSNRIFSDQEKFQEISNKTYKFFWLLVIPLIVGVLFLADGIISLIGGEGFSSSALVLRILVFALSAIFFSNFSNAILISGGKQKKMMFAMLVAAIFNISVNLIFIPRYSYLAAAIISVLTELLVVFLTWRIVSRELNYSPRAEKFWSIFGAGAGMAAYFFFFWHLNFFLLAFSATAVYAFLLWLFKAVKIEEITSILRKNKPI